MALMTAGKPAYGATWMRLRGSAGPTDEFPPRARSRFDKRCSRQGPGSPCGVDAWRHPLTESDHRPGLLVRKLIVSTIISVDGYHEGPGKDWTAPRRR
jgi:hypothetical protein